MVVPVPRHSCCTHRSLPHTSAALTAHSNRDPKTNSNQAILPYSASDKTAADRYCQARGYAAAGAVLPVSARVP